MEKKEYRQLLSQRQYIQLLLADTINRFGDSIDVIAYSWIMYEITGSASLMALVVGLNFVPTVFLTPFAGAFVDRISKKRVMALADLLPDLALKDGYIAVDRNMATNLPGVFAAGDCTGLPLQVSKAVGEGQVAGHRAAEYLDQL